MRNRTAPRESPERFDSKPRNSLKERLLPLREHAPNTASGFTVGQGKMCSVSGSK